MGKFKSIKRTVYGFSALVLSATGLLNILSPSTASAYDLITSRSIQMSSSVGGATAVSYLVTFTPNTTSVVDSIAIDFCGNSPILNDDCETNNNVALTVGTHTPSLASVGATVTGGAGIGNLTTGTWAASTVNSGRTFTLTNSGADMTFNAATPYYFTVTGVVNPTDVDNVTAGSQVGTFYARILTFLNASGADSAALYTATNVDTNDPIDAGGIALSTANQITIQSKVQERLTFCIYTTGANCPGSISNPTLLGDANGVLDPATQYTTATSTNGNPKFGIASNAAGGVVVNMKGGTLKRTVGCADGTGQPCSINPIGGTATAGAVSSEQFGLRLTNLGANITATTPYDHAANYAFDDNNTTGTQSTYGDQIASMVASGEQSGELQFVGNIANTTESGIYTTTLTFIATGTY
jgi:hypothetical protein